MAESQPDTGETPTQPATDSAQQGADTAPDLAKEVEKWQALARKHEDRAKANATAAKELEKLRTEGMTEVERAVTEAKAEGRIEALREVGTERVADAVRTALAGRDVDVDALLEGMDRTRYLGEDFTPDRDAIAAWVDRIAPKGNDRPGPQAVDLGQGARGASPAQEADPMLTALTNVIGVSRTP